MSRPTPAGVDDQLLTSVRAALDEHDRTWGHVLGDGGLVDARVKELCARFVAEDDEVVAHADDPERFDERERVALAWVLAIGWNPDAADDELWARLQAHFTDPELVELGTFISLEMGQRNWLRTFGEAGEHRLVIADVALLVGVDEDEVELTFEPLDGLERRPEVQRDPRPVR